MKVILLNDVPKLGKRFDVKEVSSGHSLNFLIPKGLAEIATPERMKRIEAEKAQVAAKKKKAEEILFLAVNTVSDKPLQVKRKANEKGHLFSAIHKDEIVALIKKNSGSEIAPDHIAYDKPIKEVGEHTVEVKVGEKNIKIKLKVQAE